MRSAVPAVVPLAVLAISASGCAAPDADTAAASAPPRCTADPHPGPGLTRLTRDPTHRGLRTPIEPHLDPAACGFIPGGLAVADLDGDGWEDLVFNHRDRPPLLAWNDRAGGLVEVDPGLGPATPRPHENVAAVDLDGDTLPELISVGQGYVAVATNLGDLRFEPWERVIWDPANPLDCHHAIALGDLDGDGDLDLSLPGLDRQFTPAQTMGSHADGWRGSEDRLFRNDGGRFVFDRTLARADHAGAPTLSLQHLFTDRDADGDLDLLAAGDRADIDFPPTAFFRNDGPGPDGRVRLVDDAPDIGADLRNNPMGHAIADFNGDGRLDYCTSDIRDRLTCLQSTPAGVYAESAAAMGLAPDFTTHPGWADRPADVFDPAGSGGVFWSTWSLALADLDNDGHDDLAAVAGPPPSEGSVARSDVQPWQPDWIWSGVGPGRFRSAVPDSDFSSLDQHYGLAAVDLDRDGARELVVTGLSGRPEIWNNPCTERRWLALHIGGAGANRDALGAWVEVETDTGRRISEVRGPESMTQPSHRVHIGLGDRGRVHRVTVRWPDGATATHTHLPETGEVFVPHPWEDAP
jgi:hypothetical protein